MFPNFWWVLYFILFFVFHRRWKQTRNDWIPAPRPSKEDANYFIGRLFLQNQEMLRCGRTWRRLIGSLLFVTSDSISDVNLIVIKKKNKKKIWMYKEEECVPCREWVRGGVMRRQSCGLPSGRTGTNGSSGSALGVRSGWAANGPFRQSSPALAIPLRPTLFPARLRCQILQTTFRTSHTSPRAPLSASGRAVSVSGHTGTAYRSLEAGTQPLPFTRNPPDV